jgi:hypothetical protein
MWYIISYIFFQIIQSSNLRFLVGSFVRALPKNGSFGLLSVGSCVGKNQMCWLCGGFSTLSDNGLQYGQWRLAGGIPVNRYKTWCGAEPFKQPQRPPLVILRVYWTK